MQLHHINLSEKLFLLARYFVSGTMSNELQENFGVEKFCLLKFQRNEFS